MMKRFIPILILLPFLWASSTLITNSERKVGFKIKNFGVMVDGTIEGFSGSLSFNKEDISASQFDFSLNVKSIRTGMADRDKAIMDAEFFYVEKYPRITFKAIEFNNIAEDRYQALGTLTIKGVNQRVMAPFT